MYYILIAVWVILIIILLAFLWWLSGFFPGRPIKRKNNRYHAYGPNDQIHGYLDGDKPKFLNDSMPYPYRAQYRSLTYSKSVDDAYSIDFKKEGKNILDQHIGQSKDRKPILYDQAVSIHGLSPIRWVTEEVNRIRKEEIHPYDIPIDMPIAGFRFWVRLLTVTKVFDPMLTLLLDQFLVFQGGELKDAVGPWGPEQELKWVTEAGLDVSKPEDKTQFKNIVINKMLGLKIDDHKSIVINGIPLMEYINARIAKYGLKILEFSLNVGYDNNVKAILDNRALQQLQDEKTILQEKENETNLKILEKQKANQEQQRDLDKKYLEEVTIPEMEAKGTMLKTSHEGYPPGTTLFMGASEDVNVTNGLLAKISTNTKQKGGTDATV